MRTRLAGPDDEIYKRGWRTNFVSIASLSTGRETAALPSGSDQLGPSPNPPVDTKTPQDRSGKLPNAEDRMTEGGKAP